MSDNIKDTIKQEFAALGESIKEDLSDQFATKDDLVDVKNEISRNLQAVSDKNKGEFVNLGEIIPAKEYEYAINFYGRKRVERPDLHAASDAYLYHTLASSHAKDMGVAQKHYDIAKKLYNALETHGRAQFTAVDQQEGNDAEGGATVPTYLESRVMAEAIDNSIFYGMLDVLPMRTKTHQYPVLTSGVDSVGIVSEEGTNQMDTYWKNSDLTAFKIGGTFRVSFELGQDNIVGFSQFVTRRIVQNIYGKLDDYLLEGSGSSQPEGVKNTTGVNSLSWVTASGVFYNLAKIMNAGGAKSLRNGMFVMRSDVFWYLQSLTVSGTQPQQQVIDTSSQYSLVPGVNVSAMRFGRIGPFPVLVCDEIAKTTTSTIYFGNFRDSVIIGQNGGLRIASSPHEKFSNDQITVKVLQRLGCLVGVPSQLTYCDSVPILS